MFTSRGVGEVLKKEILEMLNRYIASGMNLYSAIDAASKDAKEKKITTILQKVKIDADKLNNIPLALKINGLLNEREFTILLNAKKNIRIALQEIIKLSDSASLFERMMLKAIVLPWVLFIGVMYVPFFVAPYIRGIFIEFEHTLSIKPELPWYLVTVIDFAYIYAILATISLVTLVGIIWVYFFTYKNRIDLTYKMFKYKALVDTPYILNLMNSLHKSTGMNLTNVCASLKDTIAPKSLAYFFQKIAKEEKNNNLFNTFVAIGFDKGVSRLCSLGQNKGINDFWLNMEKGLVFSEKQLEIASEKWQKRSKTNMMLSFFIGIAILLNSIAYITMMSSEIEKTLKKEMGRRR